MAKNESLIFRQCAVYCLYNAKGDVAKMTTPVSPSEKFGGTPQRPVGPKTSVPQESPREAQYLDVVVVQLESPKLEAAAPLFNQELDKENKRLKEEVEKLKAEVAAQAREIAGLIKKGQYWEVRFVNVDRARAALQGLYNELQGQYNQLQSQVVGYIAGEKPPA